MFLQLKIKNMFRRKPKDSPRPLSIDDTTVTLTPRPDEAETAAAALLEMLTDETEITADNNKHPAPDKGTLEYYNALAERIRTNREYEMQRALRVVACCEEQLPLPKTQSDNIRELENELYTVQAAVERERGSLLERWQRCLAEIVVRQIRAARETDGGQAEEKEA